MGALSGGAGTNPAPAGVAEGDGDDPGVGRREFTEGALVFWACANAAPKTKQANRIEDRFNIRVSS